MNNIFITAAIISIIFLLSKFVEMRFIEKENKPLKLLIRDALIVYFSVISGYFILEQVQPMLEGEKGNILKNIPVFTGNPEF